MMVKTLGEFRRNLATYGAVKVRDDGGVDTLTVEINSENFNAILKLFKDKLIENARGYNAKDDRMGNNPNQMNIQSMYSDMTTSATMMMAGAKSVGNWFPLSCCGWRRTPTSLIPPTKNAGTGFGKIPSVRGSKGRSMKITGFGTMTSTTPKWKICNISSA